MKHFFLLFFALFIGYYAAGQTNAIRDTGKVGIGTLTPAEKLEVAADEPAAIQLTRFWDVLGPVGIVKFNMAGTEVGRIESERILPDGRQSIMKFFVRAGSNLAEYMRISNTGYIGIGTTEPAQKLDVAGYIRSAPSATEGGMYFGNANHGIRRLPATNNLEVFTTQGNISLSASSIGSNQLVLRENGDVEMGAPGVSAKLTVNGKITATKVKVSQNVWADFVFEPAYLLPSLYDLELYVKKHKHLPEMPSAKEVREKGLDLGENQAKLLQKIEELTLYVIDQHKKLEAQQKIITAQQQLLAEQGEAIEKIKAELDQ